MKRGRLSTNLMCMPWHLPHRPYALCALCTLEIQK